MRGPHLLRRTQVQVLGSLSPGGSDHDLLEAGGAAGPPGSPQEAVFCLVGALPPAPQPPGRQDIWSTSRQEGSGCPAPPPPATPSPLTLTETDVSHTRSLLLGVSSFAPAVITGPPCPEGRPYSAFQTEVSGHFLLPPAPSARRAPPAGPAVPSGGFLLPSRRPRGSPGPRARGAARPGGGAAERGPAAQAQTRPAAARVSTRGGLCSVLQGPVVTRFQKVTRIRSSSKRFVQAQPSPQARRSPPVSQGGLVGSLVGSPKASSLEDPSAQTNSPINPAWLLQTP